MELCLKWLDKYERKNGKKSPIGVILGSQKQREQIELLELDKGQSRGSEYLTQLPPEEVLAEKLHNAIQIAKKN